MKINDVAVENTKGGNQCSSKSICFRRKYLEFTAFCPKWVALPRQDSHFLQYHLFRCYIPHYKTTNLDLLLAVSMRDSRGLTAPELFGSWTRWPRLPDASLTQGQNPE